MIFVWPEKDVIFDQGCDIALDAWFHTWGFACVCGLYTVTLYCATTK